MTVLVAVLICSNNWHLIICCSEFNPKYECDVCKKIFKRLVILEKHKLDHFKPKEEEEEEEYYEEVPRKKRRRSKKMQVDKKISKRLVTMQKPKLDHVKPKEEEFYEEVPCKKRGRSKKIQDDKKVSPLKIKLEIKKEKFYWNVFLLSTCFHNIIYQINI